MSQPMKIVPFHIEKLKREAIEARPRVLSEERGSGLPAMTGTA